MVWNTDNPKTSNQILEDIADIEENLQELHDVIHAITNGTLGTTTAANFRVDAVEPANDAYLVATDNAGTGTVNLIRANTDDDMEAGSHLVPAASDTYNLGSATQPWKYLWLFQSLVCDHILERTGAAGVTIDGVLLKDGVLGANTVDSDAYVDGSIDTAHIAADQITSALIADDQIDSEHIAAGAVDNEHMAANSVDSAQYVDGSIDPEHFAAGAVAVQIFSLQTVFAEADGSDEAAYVWQGTDPYIVCRTWYYHSGGQATCYIKANVTDSGNGVTSARVVFGGVTVNTGTVDDANGDVDGSGDISGVAAGWAEVTVSGVKSASSADSTLYELGVTIA